MFTANPTLAGGPFPHTRWHAQIPAWGRRFWKNILPNPKTKNSKTYLRKTVKIAVYSQNFSTSGDKYLDMMNIGQCGVRREHV